MVFPKLPSLTSALLALVALTAFTVAGHARAARINLEDHEGETGGAWLEQARQAAQAQDFSRAEYLYQRASILPGSEEAGTVGLAHLHQLKGDSDKAVTLLKEFLTRINPFSLDAHLALVDAYLSQDQQPKAEAELQIVEKLRPGYGPSQERVGVIAFRKNNFRQAISALTKVLERNPSHARALDLRARSYLKLERFSSALADYKQLQAVEPDEIEHYVSIGRIYFQLGEHDIAGRYLAAALAASEISPAQRVRIQVLAGNLEQARGNDKKALAHFKKAFEANPRDLDLGLKLSQLYAGSRNFPQAQVTLDKIMESSPGNGDAVALALKIADLYVNTKAYSQAQRALARVMEAVPGHEGAARRMVELYSLLGRRDGLGVFLKHYVATYPDKTWATAAYAKLLGDIGDAAGAESVLAAATQNGIPSPEIALALVKQQGAGKRYAEAKTTLQKALEKFPKDDRLRFDLALCWEKLGEPKKAQQEYERVFSASSASAHPEVRTKAAVNLAHLYEAAGDPAKAYATLKAIELKAPLSIAGSVRAKLDELGRGGSRSPASERSP